MGVEDPARAVLATEGDEIPTEVVQRLDVADAEVVGAGDTEPAVGEGGEGVPVRSHDGTQSSLKRPANARSGRSALVMHPGSASTTARIALRAGSAGDGHPDRREGLGRGEVGAGLGEDLVLALDPRVALDLGDVAALDVPVRIGVRGHLPLEVHLDAGHAGDDADVLEVAATERALGQVVPAEVDVLRAGAELGLEADLVELEVEAVGHEPHRVLEDPRVLLEHARHRRVLDRPAEADLDPGVDRVVAGDVDRLDRQDVLDLGDVGRVDDRQDLRQSGVHARAVEGGAAPLAGGLDHLGLGPARRVGVVGVAVVAGDPVGGGHDVDARLEHPLVELDVGEHAVEGDAVRLRRDELLEGARRHHADGVDADDRAGVVADLVG